MQEGEDLAEQIAVQLATCKGCHRAAGWETCRHVARRASELSIRRADRDNRSPLRRRPISECSKVPVRAVVSRLSCCASFGGPDLFVTLPLVVILRGGRGSAPLGQLRFWPGATRDEASDVFRKPERGLLLRVPTARRHLGVPHPGE